MIDIWKEVTEIDVASFGWQLRNPMRIALIKLNKDYSVVDEDSIRLIANDSPKGSVASIMDTGDAVLRAFINGVLELRTAIRTSRADPYISKLGNELVGDTSGPNVRINTRDILKNLMYGANNPVEESGYSSININSPQVYVVAGNENPMFMDYDSGADGDVGLKLKWWNTEVLPEPIIVTVENILTGSKISTEIIPEPGELAPMIFTNDECTNFIDPGLLEISIRYKSNGKLVDGAGVLTDVCKFGMNPAEKLTPLGDDDFIFTDDLVTYGATKTLFYIGSADRIKLPHKLDNKDITTIGNSTFMDTNVTVAKIQEPVVSIE